jgi:hypothetical protein
MSGKYMCVRQCHIDAAAKKKAILLERDRRTVEITAKWKSGFTALKDENDRLQRERNETFKSDMAEVGAWLLDCVEGCQT